MSCHSTGEGYETALGEKDCIVYHYQNFPRTGNLDYYFYFKEDIGYLGYIEEFHGIVMKKSVLRSYELFNTSRKIYPDLKKYIKYQRIKSIQ